MTNYDMKTAVNPNVKTKAVLECERAKDCMIPMGITSENVAREFGITREQMD